MQELKCNPEVPVQGQEITSLLDYCYRHNLRNAMKYLVDECDVSSKEVSVYLSWQTMTASKNNMKELVQNKSQSQHRFKSLNPSSVDHEELQSQITKPYVKREEKKYNGS